MSDAWLRRLVAATIALLIIHEVGTWVYAAFGAAAGVISGLLVAAVSFFSTRMASAGAGSAAWFLVPTLLFTALPIAARVWGMLTTQRTAWERAVDIVPFAIGFAAPVALLLLAYLALRRRPDAGAAPRA
jgi:hypothetical protein